MKNKLLILGAGGHGKVIADIALKMNKWENIYFLDDNEGISESMGIKRIGKIEDSYKMIDKFDVFVAIGNNYARMKIQNELIYAGASIPILIHPSAIIGTDVKIGIGTVVMAGVVINCYTLIGKGCIINTNSNIDHDNSIGDYVHISPGSSLGGTVNVGEGSWLGIGSVISNNLNIINNTIVGAGAVVIKDIDKSGTYVGVPARKI